jgi:hypothetical protein
MLFEAPELRIESRMIYIIDVKDPYIAKSSPYSIEQAKILGAIAPKISPSIFSKRKFNNVMTTLEAECVAKTVDDPDRLQAIVQAYSEIVATIPEKDIVSTNE